MFGRKSTHSILSRLEALEAQKPGSLVFAVTVDAQTRRVNFDELMAMREPPKMENGIYYTGFPDWRIIEGGNMQELDALLEASIGKLGGTN